MILEEATKEAFGYYASELKPKSSKLIIAACELCGQIKVMTKHHYHTLCRSCVRKGWHHSAETKTLMKKNHADNKGEKHPMYGKHLTEEQKVKQRTAHEGEKNFNFGKRGRESTNFKGGKKLVKARSQAKRKRELGYTLLMLLAEDEVGHHITDECVIGVLEKVHVKLTGGSRRKHRTLVLQWLKANDKKKYALACLVLLNENERTI